MGIYIDFYGNVEVQVPKGTAEEQVIKLLEGKWEIIQQKIKEMKDRATGSTEKFYNEGESFLYLGNTVSILISQDINIKKDKVVLEGDKLHVYVKDHEDEKIKQALKRFIFKSVKR